MKVDFSYPIRDLKGEPIPDVTLGSITCQALLAGYEDERNLSGEEKARRYKLAMLIVDAGEVDISVEQAAEIKKLIGKAYSPLIVGRAFELLDQAKPILKSV